MNLYKSVLFANNIYNKYYNITIPRFKSLKLNILYQSKTLKTKYFFDKGVGIIKEG